MSNLQSKLSGVKFEAVAPGPRMPGMAALVLGVICPAAVLGLELVSRMCADSFFDPVPTWWHALVVALVPAGNLLLWWRLQGRGPSRTSWLACVNGAVTSIAGFYALLFLPLLPIALLAVIVLIGLLPFVPLASLVCAAKLGAMLRERDAATRSWRPMLGGLAIGIALLLAADLPAALTRLGMQWATSDAPAERVRGVALLRAAGDDELLLRLCYGMAARPTGLLSAFVIYSGDLWTRPQQRSFVSTEDAREIYYRVHGEAFNVRPVPSARNASRWADFRVDDDHGGTRAGGRVSGLSLVASRIDGSISGNDAVGYLEWTIEFRNTDAVDREVRMELALPPGGVVSRATLWVAGEEREAAYGGRGQARAAYERVAVRQRRDPLLVTTKGPDRVLAQAFPVPRNGGTIKFKLGITAPLDLSDASHARLTLPAVVDRNFSFGADADHAIWLESKQSLRMPGVSTSVGDVFRLVGTLSDRELAQTRPTVSLQRDARAQRLRARVDTGETIVQEIVPRSTPQPSSLLLVIDDSAPLAGSADAIVAALDAVAPGTRIGALLASEPVRPVTPAVWSDAQKRKIVEILRTGSFRGGEDNAPALAEAMQLLENEPNATLLWIHGPQPVVFRNSAARLEQAGARLSRLPEIVLYAVVPGPNETLPDASWTWSARTLPRTGAITADLADYLARRTGRLPTPSVHRALSEGDEAVATGSAHIARLWASERVRELMRADAAGNRAEAVALAARYRLVTPVSGAVVLESQQQYDENGLKPVSQATVPTVPEPHEWALLIAACAALGWWAWRRRGQLAASTA